MRINFVIVDQCVLPVVYVDDERIILVDFTYHWHTSTDQSDTEIMVVVDGYLPGEDILRRFTFDIENDVVTEEIIEEVDKDGNSTASIPR